MALGKARKGGRRALPGAPALTGLGLLAAVVMLASADRATAAGIPSEVSIRVKLRQVVPGQRGEAVLGRVASHHPACRRGRVVQGRIRGKFANAPLGRMRTDRRGRWGTRPFFSMIPRPAEIKVLVRPKRLSPGRFCSRTTDTLRLLP